MPNCNPIIASCASPSGKLIYVRVRQDTAREEKEQNRRYLDTWFPLKTRGIRGGREELSARRELWTPPSLPCEDRKRKSPPATTFRQRRVHRKWTDYASADYETRVERTQARDKPRRFLCVQRIGIASRRGRLHNAIGRFGADGEEQREISVAARWYGFHSNFLSVKAMIA